MQKTNVVVGKRTLYVNPDKGLVKLGSKASPLHIGEFFATVKRGEARKIRKALRADGWPQFAAVSRA